MPHQGRWQRKLTRTTCTHRSSGLRPAEAIGPRYRALILLAAFASLRWAELAALTSQDIDLDACTVRVTRQINYLRGGGHSFGPPKSRAGRRVVSFPELIAGDLRRHLELGPPPRSPSLARTARRCVIATSTGVPGCPRLPLSACRAFTFTICAIPATSSLLTRARASANRWSTWGHESARAALIYLHTSAERQRAIADQVGKNAKAALGKHKRSGTRMARKAKGTS